MLACLSSRRSEISLIAVHGAPSSKSNRISEFYFLKRNENCLIFYLSKQRDSQLAMTCPHKQSHMSPRLE